MERQQATAFWGVSKPQMKQQTTIGRSHLQVGRILVSAKTKTDPNQAQLDPKPPKQAQTLARPVGTPGRPNGIPPGPHGGPMGPKQAQRDPRQAHWDPKRA